MGSSATYTPEEIEDAIASALRARDMSAVVALLGKLAVVAPDRAQVLLEALNIITGAG